MENILGVLSLMTISKVDGDTLSTLVWMFMHLGTVSRYPCKSISTVLRMWKTSGVLPVIKLKLLMETMDLSW